MTEPIDLSRKIGYLDALILPRSIRYSCNGDFTGNSSFCSTDRTTDLAIGVLSSIEIHRVTLTGGTPTEMDLVETVDLPGKVCSMATVPIRFFKKSVNDVRHIQDGIMFTLEDCSIGFLLYDNIKKGFVHLSQGSLPTITRSKNNALTACGHKIMVESSRSWLRVWVYTNENYISRFDFDHEMCKNNSSSQWLDPWLAVLARARNGLASLYDIFETILPSLYYPFGAVKDINMSWSGDHSSFIFIVDTAPGTQAVFEWPVTKTAKIMDYDSKMAGVTRHIVRNMGLSKVQKWLGGSIAIGNNGFIEIPSFSTHRFNKIKEDSINEILLFIEWKSNDSCIAIVSQTSRSNISSNLFVDDKKLTDAVAIIIKRNDPLHPIYIDIDLQNMTPISWSFLSSSVLFIAGHSKSVIFQIHEEPAYLFEPLLEFTGLGPITDIKRIRKPGFSQQAFCAPQLVLACTVAGSAFGGSLAIVGSDILPDAVKGYQDEQHNFPVSLFEILHMGSQYIIASYLGDRLRVLKVDRRNTPQRNHQRVTTSALEERSEILEEIKNLDKLPFELNNTGARLVLAKSVSYDCCLFAYNDEIVVFRKNKKTVLYSALLDDPISDVKSAGLALLVRSGRGNIYWLQFHQHGESFDCTVTDLDFDEVSAIEMFGGENPFAVLISGDAAITVNFVEDGEKLQGLLKNDKKDLIDSMFLKSIPDDESVFCFISYATGIVEVWSIQYTSRKLSYLYTICVGDSPTKLIDHDSMILAVNECISLSEDGRYFRPLVLPGTVEDFSSSQRFTALHLTSGECVLATDKNIMLIKISNAVSDTYHRSFSIPGVNYCTPFRLCQLHNGHLVTLNRHNPTANSQSYSFTIWNQNLQVIESKPVLESIVPFTLTELSDIDGFLIGGEEDAYKVVTDTEKRFWISYNEAKNQDDSYTIRPTSDVTASAADWSEGQIGHLMAFESDDIGEYQQIISIRTEQGPILVAKDIFGDVLFTIGGGYSIEPLHALRDKNLDNFRIDWSSQTSTLCIAADASFPYVALADMMNGVIISFTEGAKRAKRVQYWKYSAERMATDVIFLPSEGRETPELEARLMVTNEKGGVSLLQLQNEDTFPQNDNEEIESRQDGDKVIKLAGKVELSEPINKICLNGDSVWNPCTYRTYESFFEPQAILAGSEGGIYQFGWLKSEGLERLSTNWYENEDGEDHLVDCIDVLFRLQRNLKIVWGSHSSMRWSFDDFDKCNTGQTSAKPPLLSGDERFINGVLLRKYWNLSFQEQETALGNESIDDVWLESCGKRHFVEELLRKLESIAR